MVAQEGGGGDEQSSGMISHEQSRIPGGASRARKSFSARIFDDCKFDTRLDFFCYFKLY